MKNILVAQSGGPTAAINATLAGVITCAYSSKNAGKVYGACNGIQGVLEERFIDLREKLTGTEELSILCQTPAAALGSCRLKLKEESQLKEIVDILHKHEISCFVYIGGNDSMDTVDQLSAYCRKHQITDISVMGAPKTIDNDLMGTDHCPGFGSAARYIAETFSELERDCHVYTTKAVTIVEVMGRNAGWLTAASALARVNGEKGPNLIYLCERAFDNEQFLADVQEQLKDNDSVVVAISEGIKDKDGRYVSEQVQSSAVDNFGHSYIAGSAKVLEELVRERIGCKVRSIELNLMQRCAAHIASDTDIQESRMLGMCACQAALEGESGKMAAVIRLSDEPYQVKFDTIPVCEAANAEKKVPEDFITEDGHDVTEKMMKYLKPLILGDRTVTFENGIAKHIILY
ncbi:MAG: 6-phosphofructokinase [Lachnospiraceae bacterium]|nr:6-phosphofructokinase [Lachnospiraceae bacterium]